MSERSYHGATSRSYTLEVAAYKAVSHGRFVVCRNKVVCSAHSELGPVTGDYWTMQLVTVCLSRVVI